MTLKTSWLLLLLLLLQLTCVGFLRWLIEGEAQGHHGSHLQDDQRDILQCLPYQRKEGLRGFRRDDIGAESLSPVLHVTGISTQPCNVKDLYRRLFSLFYSSSLYFTFLLFILLFFSILLFSLFYSSSPYFTLLPLILLFFSLCSCMRECQI